MVIGAQKQGDRTRGYFINSKFSRERGGGKGEEISGAKQSRC